MTRGLSAPIDFETELQRISAVKAALVTDSQGVVLLRAGSSSDEAALQRMAATFALTTDQANKLRLGKNKQITLFYGAWPCSRSRQTHTLTAPHSPLHSVMACVVDLACPVALLLADTMALVHASCPPLVLTLVCDR